MNNPMLQTILSLFSSAAQLGGGVWLVWGVITFALGLKDHSGPQTQSGIWQIIGGAMIIAAAAYFKQITIA